MMNHLWQIPCVIAAALCPALNLASAAELHPAPSAQARLFLRFPASGDGITGLTLGPKVVPGALINVGTDAGTRSTDIRFPVQWWRWSQVILEFTAAFDGEVELALAGPWNASPDGSELRQEILWDEITAVGTSLENGGFEQSGASAPHGWDSPWSPYPSADSWPLAGAPADKGQRCGAAWHGRPLTQSLAVRTGETIRLTLHARAATPPDFQAPRPLPPDTPAHRACKRLARGVNLGNGWESAPGDYQVPFLPQDIDHIADEGLDHIRVPVAWHHHINGDTLSAALLKDLEPVLRQALHRGLSILLVWQNHPDLMEKPDLHREAFISGWRSIAKHFKDWPEPLFFNLLNEPSNNLTGAALDALHRDTIAAIRASNPQRTLVVEPGHWSTVAGLDRLRLPDDDANLIVSIHCYEPFPITHQEASWVGMESLRELVFPGPPTKPVEIPSSLRSNSGLSAWISDYNTKPADRNPGSQLAFEPLLAQAAAWSARFGRPIHIGEFGATRKMDPASRAAYARAFRQAASRHKLPWCWWEWKAGFGCWDDENQRPLLGDALVGPLRKQMIGDQ